MVLVTGTTGFIGSHVADSLAARGIPSRYTTRQHFESQRNLAETLEGVGTVVHLAGATKALHPEDYYTSNVGVTEMLLRAIAQRDVRLVHVSSLAAAGPSPDGRPVSEDDEPHPLTHYGKSKLQAERLVRQLKPDAVIIRPPVVYGPRDTGVFTILKSISRGIVLEIAGGERRFSIIHVDDLVDGLLLAAQAPEAPGRTYYLAHSKSASWGELALTAARIMKRRPLTLRIPVAVARGVGRCADQWSRITGRPGIVSREKVVEAECRWWICDTRRAMTELGFEARIALEDGLARTLAWYKGAGWLAY